MFFVLVFFACIRDSWIIILYWWYWFQSWLWLSYPFHQVISSL